MWGSFRERLPRSRKARTAGVREFSLVAPDRKRSETTLLLELSLPVFRSRWNHTREQKVSRVRSVAPSRELPRHTSGADRRRIS
jgi:hypothetical protein